MAPGRKLQFHNPHPVPPAPRRRYKPFGQDDGSDFYDGGGADYSSADFNTATMPDSTTLSELVVTASPPATPIDVQAQPSLLPDEPWLTPSAPLDISGLTSAFTPPNFQPGTGASNPIQNLLKSLFPPGKKSAGGGASSGGAPAAPKLQSSPTVPKPATTTTPASATAATPLLWWGAGAAGLVFLAAALSGHHHRRRR